jgi:hypothetical protein
VSARVAAAPGAPSVAELAAAVLRRRSGEVPGDAVEGIWRGRSADEALLLIELCRWLEGCHRQRGTVRPAPVGLADAFVGLARRRAPLPPVRAFVRAVVRLAQAELADTGERADRDADAVVGLLELCFRAGSGPARVHVDLGSRPGPRRAPAGQHRGHLVQPDGGRDQRAGVDRAGGVGLDGPGQAG